MMRKSYGWETVYLAAVLETDDRKLPELIAKARAVINARYDRMPEGDMDERNAIANALSGLRSLREERVLGRRAVKGSEEAVRRAFGLAS